ncbi:3'(2'),5'-bisphosphate nucleotidase [Ruficoccus amylovorans]|uniref:3'(2'),5'-bisphosphate nucleotidase n=2 Tax=Ruficoccus amylovorans TaxID=1804625 RepID=A0A842H8V9_9BACT|nr:3'(2'),5'-bisphosphate nucleotidase [Ruficoccus amylovorans]
MSKFEHFSAQMAIDAVRKAALLCAHVRANLTADGALAKNDKSPVTIADYGSQAVILHLLQAATPDIPVVAEEDADALRADDNAALRAQVFAEVRRILPQLGNPEILAAIDRGNHTGGPAGRFWTLDPIDGTKGFLRNDQYAIALALVEDGQPVMGVLGCPELPCGHEATAKTGCLLAACRGEGAWLYPLDAGEAAPVKVSSTADTALACFCESVESGHSRHDWSATVAEKLGITRPSVRMDSQCKYASIARGDADIYLRLPTRPGYEEKIWDHAAGCLVVEEAGGTVTDIRGKPLDFSAGRTLRHNSGVVATNGRWHDQVIAAIQAATPA